ncbi:MAG: peptidyl-prolyl cis-trans isomerase, partial [bacterium]
MKSLCVFMVLCVWSVPVIAAEDQVSDATAELTEHLKPTPIPRTAVVFSYLGHEVPAGVFLTINSGDLRQAEKETEDVQKEVLNELVENTLFRILVAAEAKKVGMDKAPKPAELVRRNEIRWLARYYIAAMFHENYNKTDEDYKAYYEEHLDEFREIERFQFRHIFFKTVDEPPEKQEQALRRAQEALARIKAGSDFVAVADEYSDSPKKGAVFGPFNVYEEDPEQRINPKLQETILALEPGKFSDIIETKYGYEILRLDKYIKPEPKEFRFVRRQIDQTMREEYLTNLKAGVLEKCLDEAVTEWNPGIVDDASAEDDALICRVYGEPLTVGFYQSLFTGGGAPTRMQELQEKGRDAFIRERLVFLMIAYKKSIEMGLDKR